MYTPNYINLIAMENMNMTNFPGRTYRYLQVPALFEFGYGLSYTTFEYRWNIALPDRISRSDIVKVQVEVVNSGIREGMTLK